jgi:Lrp/AsnC family transcriptional regulator for asnA, asnC and gidA
MIKGLMVIKAESGKWKSVVQELMELPQVKQISSLAGIYDLMVELQVEEMEDLNDVMLGKIDLIDGIISTNTFIVLKDYK